MLKISNNFCIDQLAEAKKENKDIYIFGADIVGKVIYKILNKNGIKVKCFIDNNNNKCVSRIDTLKVEHAPRILLNIDKSSIILIASTYILDIINQLESYGLYSWSSILSVLKNDQSKTYDHYITGNLKKNYSGGEFTGDFVNFAVSNMVTSQKKYLDPKKLYIRSMDIIISEKCSLKCKDCSNLMQYYEKPINIGMEELKEDYEDLNSICDELNEIRIIGGEPLMNKDFHLITSYATQYKNFNKVVVYTNGTICPPDEKLNILKNEKTFVFITTYGELSKNAERLANAMERLNINYNIQPAYGWTDSGKIKNYDRNNNINKTLFKNCCAKHFTTLTDGKIFRCPFSANVERLKAIPDNKDDFFNIRGVSKSKNKEVLKLELKKFLREKDLISACNFCNGRSYGQPEITPGIQTKNPIEYDIYPRKIVQA